MLFTYDMIYTENSKESMGKKKDSKVVFDVQEDVGILKIFIKKPLGRKKMNTQERTHILIISLWKWKGMGS